MPTVRRRTENGDGDEEFEVLDVAARGWVKDLFKDVDKGSAALQLTVGGAAGWCTGYIFGKAGKATAAALGGSLLLLQIAHHQGYVKINWNKVQSNVNKAKEELERRSQKDIPTIVTEKIEKIGIAAGIIKKSKTQRAIEEVSKFVKDNALVAGGFAGGFFIGLAS